MLLFILLHLFHCASSSSSTNTSEELEALLEFKKNVNYNGSDWNSENGHILCTWTGIGCDSTNLHVVSIHLANLGLTGTISPALIRLTSLHTLNLSSNSITGSLEPAIAQHLKNINLSGNKLSGPIPTSWSSGLEFLDLSHNVFSGTVPDICTPSGDSQLRYVDLSANKLVGQLPESFGSCSKLQSLQVCYNTLHGRLPASLNNCSLLRELKLDWNNLHGEIFVEFPHLLTNLDTLEIAGNGFSGELPSQSTGMIIVNLAHNNFTGRIPEAICSWNQLIVFSLGFNNLGGGIPSCMQNLTSLQVLDLSNNHLTGSLPPGLENLKGFQQLGNSSSFLRIRPAEIQDILGANKHAFGVMKGGVWVNYPRLLQDLKVFDISNNFLHGEIPSSLGELVGIRLLNLSRNNFQGEIPPELGKMSNLLSLDMSHNHLHGEIPAALTELPLSSFSVAYNNLSGLIPTGSVFNTRFGVESFEGNPELVGCPVTCLSRRGIEISSSSDDDSDDDFSEASFSIAFFVSFCVSLCITLFTVGSRTRKPRQEKSSQVSSFQWLSLSTFSSVFTTSDALWGHLQHDTGKASGSNPTTAPCTDHRTREYVFAISKSCTKEKRKNKVNKQTT